MQRRIGHNVWDAEGCFCCAVQLLLVPSNITLLRSISDVFSREQISVKDIDIVSLNSPAAAWSHSKRVEVYLDKYHFPSRELLPRGGTWLSYFRL